MGAMGSVFCLSGCCSSPYSLYAKSSLLFDELAAVRSLPRPQLAVLCRLLEHTKRFLVEGFNRSLYRAAYTRVTLLMLGWKLTE